MISRRRSTRPLITHRTRSAMIDSPKATIDHGSTPPNARVAPAITTINPSAMIELRDEKTEGWRDRRTENRRDGETKKPRRRFFSLPLFLSVSPSLRLFVSPSLFLSISLSLALDKREVVKPDCPTCGVVITEPWGSHDGQSHHPIGRRDKTDGESLPVP